jgi:acyl-CoA reductase-like NAD-dependent aldehyde dehydrogenase
MINSVLPALIAGNAVILKPSPQTPLTAIRFKEALNDAGFPADLIQVVHLSLPLTQYVVQHSLVNFVVFTGSVAGGKAIEKAAVAAEGFKGVGLEVPHLLMVFNTETLSQNLAWRKGSGLC